MEKPKISADRNKKELKQHVNDYCKLALELGADESMVIASSNIVIEEALAFKCRVPRCYGYGRCGNCPPHAPKPAEIRELLQTYHWAVFFIRRVSPELLKRDRSDNERRAAFRGIYDIVKKIESTAFYHGHYLAVGFGAGSCLSAFCDFKQGCRVIKGKSCAFPLQARPSMEGVGIDVYRLITDVGWDIYPFGQGADIEEIPTGTLAGIVLIQ